jgi:rod shape-determining protein MreD
LLLIAQAVGTVVRLAAGAEFPGWSLAIGPLAGALLWPPLSLLLLAPQRGPREVDDTRPI